MQNVASIPLDVDVPALVPGGHADKWLERNGVTLVCAMALFCATVLYKFSVPPLGARGISLTLVLLPLVAVVGAAARMLTLDAFRLSLFLLLTGVLSVISLFGVKEFSVSSIAMFAVVHLPFIFIARRPDGLDAGIPAARTLYSFFLNLALVIAFCGLAQFFLQRLIPVRFLFPIENFVPTSFVTQHFNSQGVLTYGSETYRANGVFLPEPSYFSQLMAVAIVLELCMLGRWLRLGIYGAALLTASAGTGVMIVALCVPMIMIGRGRWDLLLIGLVVIAVVGAVGESSYMGHLASRTGEFNSAGSSAFARFVGGFYLFDEFLWDDPWRTLFGFGAGSFTEFANLSHYSVAEMPLFKMTMEFGLIGATVYFLVVGYFLFASSAPKILSLALAIALLLNGIYAVFAQALAVGLLVWPFAGARGSST
jgi:hypothetical protein